MTVLWVIGFDVEHCNRVLLASIYCIWIRTGLATFQGFKDLGPPTIRHRLLRKNSVLDRLQTRTALELSLPLPLSVPSYHPLLLMLLLALALIRNTLNFSNRSRPQLSYQPSPFHPISSWTMLKFRSQPIAMNCSPKTC
jgi:hypothetical protein